jgi:hypothetical protein
MLCALSQPLLIGEICDERVVERLNLAPHAPLEVFVGPRLGKGLQMKLLQLRRMDTK